ncbi:MULTISPECIES: hypothetical protein [Halomonas]|uniref:hypothetical protein n=1 Tax=Halomonas TaxID=2745 RepID=UPI001A8D99C4|nr:MULTISPECIES: hypothetical protein [Halomonas]MED5296700.1 hypothetical protein [Pseudomonadota bacterium]MBN8410680.1 hypothetical protein [Halomonas litopenaei]MBY5925679.1 hypothetical protein [Halomonas sp. DP4Y7-2]MBY5930661.1 hypothetical protein [Halomonas sp. DP8Y7-3]MBY5969283.1 hypothetical protein [Halomonas denitrificans]
MLISDSMSTLWLIYAALSLVVLLTGYLGLAFLPRMPRLVVTWAVAGVMWMPSAFDLPLVEEGQVYNGQAPAIMVAAVAFMDGRQGVMLPAATRVIIGAAIGAVFGLALWWAGRRRRVRKAAEAASRQQQQEGGQEQHERQEPVLR